MTEERDERMVAALESIAVSLERLAPLMTVDVSETVKSLWDTNKPWPAAWSMGPIGVTTS